MNIHSSFEVSVRLLFYRISICLMMHLSEVLYLYHINRPILFWLRLARGQDEYYSGLVHFLPAQKMNQKRAPKMTTQAHFRVARAQSFRHPKWVHTRVNWPSRTGCIYLQPGILCLWTSGWTNVVKVSGICCTLSFNRYSVCNYQVKINLTSALYCCTFNKQLTWSTLLFKH